jgi:hypothetical protein
MDGLAFVRTLIMTMESPFAIDGVLSLDYFGYEQCLELAVNRVDG